MSKQVLQQALEALENSSETVFICLEKANLRQAAIEALRSALAQQVEQPWRNEYDEGYTAGRQHSAMIEQEARAYKEAYFKLLEQMASLKTLEPAPPIIIQAAPAAQPTCKQDLQVETEQERYVRMCPDIECGRKKQCTRMVGVSCMSRADIGTHGIGADK